MMKTIRRSGEYSKVSMRGAIMRCALLLAACFAAAPAGVRALGNGDPAEKVLGQTVMTKGFANDVTAAGFDLPSGAAVGGGRVYMADSNNNRVLWWTAAGFINGKAADGVIGQSAFTGVYPNQGGAIGDNTLWAPAAVSVDALGNVWVADRGNNRVLRFPAPAGAFNPAADLVLGQTLFSTNGAGLSQTGLSGPSAAVVDALGNAWVADTGNNRVLRFPSPLASGGAADTVLGQALFTTGAAALTQAGLDSPAALAVDAATNVWVADAGNNRVVRFYSPMTSGVNADMVLGQADYVSGASNRGAAVAANSLNGPLGLALDGTALWVADSRNNRALKFANPLSVGQNANLVLGQSVFTSSAPNRGVASAAANSLAQPAAVAPDGLGDVWVADASNNRLLHYAGPAANGAAADVALGQKDLLHSAVNTPTSQNLYSPDQVAVDPASGRLYAADFSNNRVLFWNVAADAANGAAADGVLGQADLTSTLANRGGAASASSLNGPAGVAVDAAGNLWVSDSANARVLRYAAPVAGGQAATRVLGQTDFISSAEGDASAVSLSNPAGLAFDALGRLWVADTGHNRVLRFSGLTVDGAAGDFVLGQADLVSGLTDRGAPAGQNTLDAPFGVSVDANGAVWVADTGNNRVLRFNDFSRHGPNADLVLGQAGFTNVMSGASASALNQPTGVLTDSAVGVWVMDSFNSRVLRYGAPLASGMAAGLVLGQADFTSAAANRGALAPAANSQSRPSAAYMDAVGRLWLADAGNNRLIETPGLPMTGLAPVASAVDSGGFTMSWTSVLGAQYVAVLAADSAFASIVSSATQAGASKVYGGLSEYTTYYFQVKLSTESDAAFTRSAAAVRTAANNTLLAPLFTAASTSSLSASWNAVGGATYVVALSSNSDFNTIAWSATQAGNTAQVGGLLTDILYYLRVKLNTEPDAAYGVNTVSGRTLGAGTPLSVRVNANASDMISANWDYVEGAKFVLALARDAAYTDIVSSFTTQAGLVSGNFTGLQGLTSYYFEMKIATEADSAYSVNRAVVKTQVTQLFPSVTDIGYSSFTVAWTSATGLGVNYVAVMASDAGFTNILSSATQTAAWLVFNAPASDTDYYFQVKHAGEGDEAFAHMSNNGAIRTQPFPLAPTMTPLSATSLSASWTAAGAGTYNVVLSTDPLFGTVTSSTIEAAVAKTFSGLSPYTVYYLKVKQAAGSEGAYLYSMTQGTTLPEGTPLTPVVSAVSSTTFKVSWTAGPGASVVLVLGRDPAFAAIASSVTAAAGQAFETYADLAGDTSYYLRMKLSTENDLAYLLNEKLVRTLPTPLAPALAEVSAGKLRGSWNSVPGAWYVVALSSDPWFNNIVSSVTTQSPVRDFQGLIGGLPYYMQVKVTGETDGAFQVNRVASVAPAGNTLLSAVTPSEAVTGKRRYGMRLTGQGIEPFCSLKMTKAGEDDVVATDIVWQSPTLVTFTLPEPPAPGKWSLVMTGPSGVTGLADAFTLMAAAPNTAKIYGGVFKPGEGGVAQLTSSLVTSGQASIRVYDPVGRLIKEIFSGNRAAGSYLDTWDGKADSGSMTGSGVYLVRFEAPGFKLTKRVVLVK
ncbi:MAG: FlgD immunoglobulin-like domain containing protein [Elusimicrobiota bacterium]|jgi:sugar lactone lactonase YvrE